MIAIDYSDLHAMIKKNIIRSPVSLCIIILCISLACGQIGSVSGTGIKLGYPALDYTGLAWRSETGLAAVTADDAGGVTGYYLENDGHLYSLELPPFVAKLDCKGVNENNNIYYAHPSILPDGRLGLINGCISRGDPPGLKRRYLIAYDFQTKETQLLVKEPLPNYLSNAFTWNPDMTAGLVQIYDGLNGTIYWISPEKVEPVDFAISDGKRSFLPGKDFPRFSEGPEQGIVFSPAWSTDGKTIAFFVTLDAMGRRDSSRSEGEYKIFFMDPLEQKPGPVVGKIHDPSELIWSPDSKWLAFIGTYGILKTHGIWMYSVETGKIYRVASGEFSQIAWSPAGNKIAAAICEPDHPNLLCNRYEIWEYDVSSILKR
jgi:WD40 repeat protein